MRRAVDSYLEFIVMAKPSLAMTVLCLILCVSPAHGDDEDLRALELYNGSATDIVSATRSPRPASQTAENITVVTASEIEALNAHTLADILASVTGIQLEMNRTPGTTVNVEIQGSTYNHVLLLIDNVPMNNLADNFPDIAAIPVQMIERVEIVKGAASTSWGSALGGVINVITRTPQPDRPIAGMVSGSVGRRTTADSRGEISGTVNGLGYYATVGNLRSDGLLANNMVEATSVYGKLQYELPVRGSLTLSSLFTGGSSGELAYQPRDLKVNDDKSLLVSALSVHYPVSDQLSVEGSVRVRVAENEQTASLLSSNTAVRITNDHESSVGGSLNLSWVSEMQRFATGVDFDRAEARVSMPLQQADQLNTSAERVGVYLNDTFTLGRFALTPSGRYDHTGTGGDQFSPSFGITYALTDNSLLRGYTAWGYSLTSLNRSDSTEKVWTSQIGVESGDVPYLWLKGTLFRNDTWNISVNGPDPNLKQRQMKNGLELEARTLPFHNTSLSLGYTFIDARDGDTDAVIHGIPRHSTDIGLRYQDPNRFRAVLLGRYVDWNDPGGGGKYGAMIWDLHLGKTFQLSEKVSLELFLSVRNLFDGDQYSRDAYKNVGRWSEAGVRCKF